MTVTTDPKIQALTCFTEKFGSLQGAALGWAPGRVNLIGEHTDYNDGFVLPMAIDLGVAVVARPRSDLRVRLFSTSLDDLTEFDIHEAGSDTTPAWARYVGGVVDSLYNDAKLVTGIDAVVVSDLPMGGGLSSSAALETATAMAMQAAFDLTISPVSMALLCQAVENKYAGVQCGVMDQFASRLGGPNAAIFLDCRSLKFESIALQFDGVELLVIDTNVVRSLDGSAFNERVAQCAAGVSSLIDAGHQIESLRDADENMLIIAKGALDETIFRRCRHVVREIARVEAAVAALRTNAFDRFGELLWESHRSLRDDYEVSCAEYRKD